MTFASEYADKKTILIMTAQYLPAFKAGGQVKAVAGMVEKLGEDFKFKVITSDRDSQDSQKYNNIKVNEWQRVGNANVFYCSFENKNIFNIQEVINSTSYDILYLNSFFDPRFTIIPLILRLFKIIRRTPIIVAPHGEFSKGAMSIKKHKKRIYLIASKLIGLFNEVLWQASNEYERLDIERELCFESVDDKDNNPIIIAPDIILEQTMVHNSEVLQHPPKKSGILKIIFLSRICIKKNLIYALQILNDVKCYVQFDIYGPIDRDEKYWEDCKQVIEKLPQNIRTRYLGPIEPNKVQATFTMYDLFLFPTLGENFGYVIMESLSGGCPVLISDQTPWDDLEEKEAGWSITLDKPERFKEIIERLSLLSNEEYQRLYNGAFKLALGKINDRDIVDKNRLMFLNCM
jgi:glycosyltransferase involved in cell wall biosynthesis